MKENDRKYREWISRQPSCISAQFSEFINGEGRNPACHVRRSSTSGTGFKAEFSCVPMTHAEHWDQHCHGEAGCLRMHRGGNWTRDTATTWFDQQVKRYRKMWEELNT
jgi:hypothetical protein